MCISITREGFCLCFSHRPEISKQSVVDTQYRNDTDLISPDDSVSNPRIFIPQAKANKRIKR